MKQIVISESKKTNYVSSNGNRYRTKMVVTHRENGKKTNGKPAKISFTSFEPIYEK